jgi:hypothetical protein
LRACFAEKKSAKNRASVINAHRGNVAFWHEADIAALLNDIRFRG